MSSKPQVFLEAKYAKPFDYVRAGRQAIPSSRLPEKLKGFFIRLTTVLDCLWSFYEPMRRGKPLPEANETLALLGSAMRTGNKDRSISS